MVSPSSPSVNRRGDGLLRYAPGELISIYGARLGPSPGVGPLLNAEGVMPSEFAGVRVLFEGVPGPVLYASTNQINAIVPFTLYGRDQVRVQLEYSGILSDAYFISMRETAPSLFGVARPGSLPLPIVINPDGSLNSANPAPAGSIVILYATGLGRTSPAGRDGHLASTPLPTPLAPVTIDAPFSVLYAGSAPGMVEGAIQVNLQLPRTPVSGWYELKCGETSAEFYINSK